MRDLLGLLAALALLFALYWVARKPREKGGWDGNRRMRWPFRVLAGVVGPFFFAFSILLLFGHGAPLIVCMNGVAYGGLFTVVALRGRIGA
jgi:hypothetical protein